MAALTHVSATMPNNYIAYEYPQGHPDWWYDIVEGLPEGLLPGRPRHRLGQARRRRGVQHPQGGKVPPPGGPRLLPLSRTTEKPQEGMQPARGAASPPFAHLRAGGGCCTIRVTIFSRRQAWSGGRNARSVFACDARGDARARLGSAGFRRRVRGCVCGPSLLWTRHHRARAGGCRLPRVHAQPAGLPQCAGLRALWAGPSTASWSPPATSTPWSTTTPRPSARAPRTCTPRAAGRACGRTARRSSTATASTRPSARSRSSSAAWRPRSGALRTTTIGTTASAIRSWPTAARTCSPTAWRKSRPCASRTACATGCH